MLHCVQVAKDCRYRKVIVESDCKMTVNMINEHSIANSTKALVKSILNDSRLFDSIVFQFVNREENSMADWIAKTASTAYWLLCIIDTHDFYKRKLVSNDKFGEPIIKV